MTKQPKNPPWTIRVGEKAHILNEFAIPHHQISSNELKAYLRAVVADLMSADYEDMASFYIARRKGTFPRRAINSKWFHHPERLVCGYFFGDWEHYAEATYPISPAENEALLHYQRQNTMSS